MYSYILFLRHHEVARRVKIKQKLTRSDKHVREDSKLTKYNCRETEKQKVGAEDEDSV